MSWWGYASIFFLLIIAGFVLEDIPKKLLEPLMWLSTFGSWSLLPWILGLRDGGEPSLISGIIASWSISGIIIGFAVLVSLWGAGKGLAGNFGRDETDPGSAKSNPKFGKEPLLRKELLWFLRDRSAIVQAILIPGTLAGMQLMRAPGIIAQVGSAWNYICGAGVVFGSYFLLILGPRSLASEGQALWIALTWPRGLESLLKAKARLWGTVANGVVAVFVLFAVAAYPSDFWKILLLSLGWLIFLKSLSEKSVTLVTPASSSGELSPASRSWSYAANIGTFTFAIGVLSEQWNVAIVGIVYSWATAAALWQNFRARLPYLYDPWSEKLPPAPTLLHSLVAICGQAECAAVFSLLGIFIAGRENLALAQSLSYIAAAIVAGVVTSIFLNERRVKPAAIWKWRESLEPLPWNPAPAAEPFERRDWSDRRGLVFAIATAVCLAVFANAFVMLLEHTVPMIAELLRVSRENSAKVPQFKLSYSILAIFAAPIAEEYLFRGLLYRALDREWGGWKAICGSAMFFTVFHPWVAWLPVFLVGVATAFTFKKTHRLYIAVLLHLLYNAIVVLSDF